MALCSGQEETTTATDGRPRRPSGSGGPGRGKCHGPPRGRPRGPPPSGEDGDTAGGKI